LKHRQGPGVLVLDEPFLAMDGERETRALELLRDFHDRNGWQIILLTKEAHLRDKVLKTFSQPRIIDLTRSGG
jgi:ABC-type Mn2+/Zn2+ transport system ATPase subunit